jgi:hypothetical protein
MDPNKRAVGWQRRLRDRRRRICQCTWISLHLCAFQRPCVAHSRAEYEYADSQVSGRPFQLRLF